MKRIPSGEDFGMSDTPRTDAAVITSETDERLAGELVAADDARKLERENAALRKALMELHAMVWGECPSLLNEDSGGSGRLDVEIRALLDPPPAKGDSK